MADRGRERILLNPFPSSYLSPSKVIQQIGFPCECEEHRSGFEQEENRLSLSLSLSLSNAAHHTFVLETAVSQAAFHFHKQKGTTTQLLAAGSLAFSRRAGNSVSPTIASKF